MKSKLPIVLTIDDDEQSATRLNLLSSAEVIARSPDEVTSRDLRRASVVLVDYQLEEWPGRDATTAISLKPANGVALAAVLRSQADALSSQRGRRAFAIHSGRLNELAGDLPAPSREHVIARTLNLEWAFAKTRNPNYPPLKIQVAALARAINALPTKWPSEPQKALAVVHKLLAAPAFGDGWRERAMEDVGTCQPPIHAWASATNGMAFVRWLLHQILPYPTFLWDERYLAARLRVSVASLRVALKTKGGLRPLAGAQYTGVLEDFVGQRWWRAGIEHILWKLSAGDPFNADLIRTVVQKGLPKALVPLGPGRPVVCVDPATLRPTDECVDAAKAIEVRPDDWPAFAEQAWVSPDAQGLEDVSALVVPQDRERAGLE